MLAGSWSSFLFNLPTVMLTAIFTNYNESQLEWIGKLSFF